MTRGDVRLIVAILGAALVSSAATAIVLHVATPRSAELEHRVHALEARPAPPPPAPVIVTPPPPPLAPPPVVVTLPPELQPCDEVACVLDNYEHACCAQFRKVPTVAHPADPPDNIDRAMISESVAKVKSKITACGDRWPSVNGKVKVRVRVAPDGSVSSVTVVTAPENDPGLGACVAGEMVRAKFPKTVTGGTFSYPFVF